MTIVEFAKKVIQLIGAKSKLTMRPLPVNDPQVRQPDITKAKKELGWEPKVPLEEGLAKTIEYFKKEPNI